MNERVACVLLLLAPTNALALHTSIRAPASRRASLRLSAAETSEYDVVVIGSGIGGLSAAAAAASTAARYGLFERDLPRASHHRSGGGYAGGRGGVGGAWLAKEDEVGGLMEAHSRWLHSFAQEMRPPRQAW